MKAFSYRPFQLLLFGVALMSIMCAAGCDNKEKEAPKLKEKVTFCQGGHVTLLTLTAQERKFFEAEGIEAQVNKLGSGMIAMDTFIAGDCNFGIMGEPPIVKKAFERDDFVIIASLANSGDFTRILARKDRGIASGKDLKGKRLAVNKGTTSLTFADMYLKKHGLTSKDVSIQFMDLKDMPAALMEGDVDAYSSTGTYFLEGKRRLGENAVLLNDPGLYPGNSFLVVKKDFLAAKGETVNRVLKALARAEADIASRHDDAVKLLAGIWKVSEDDAKFLLKDEKHVLTLGQQQLDALVKQAQWILNAGVVEKKPIPDFRAILVSAPLAVVRPDAVK